MRFVFVLLLAAAFAGAEELPPASELPSLKGWR